MLNSFFFVLVAVLREGSSGIPLQSDSGVKIYEYPTLWSRPSYKTLKGN
jgi:hypothetical protein